LDSPLLQTLFDLEERRPLTVSELNAEVRGLLERKFASVWVEGEVVNFTAHSSGHWYFNLNDGTAQIRCVCWKGTNYRIRFRPENGITVRVRGRLSLYEARGEFQLVVESLEPSGEGALRAAFEQIRSKLESEGLFAPELKRQLPFFPRKVGIVTSQTGAAYHDIVTVLTRRARSVGIVLAAAQVQGEGAADSIRRAVVNLNRFNETLAEHDRIDVVIIGRGGGSAEDLWAFNDELLARAIRSSAIPVISAVGHEIDWTICDLIADERAATPSAAAEMVAAREEDIIAGLRAGQDRLLNVVEYTMLDLGGRLRDAAGGLQMAFSGVLQNANGRYASVAARMSPATLNAKTTQGRNDLGRLDQRGGTAIETMFKAKTEAVKLGMAKLDALSPLGVLTRGYSITQTQDGRILRDPETVKTGDKLKIQLERGKLDAEVLPSE
jgi:exodeoxyribonuclease VII large subunit